MTLARFLCSFFLICCISRPGSAQREIPVAFTRVEATSKATIIESTEKVTFNSYRWTIGGIIPLPLTKKLLLAFAPQYQLWTIDTNTRELSVHAPSSSHVSAMRSLANGQAWEYSAQGWQLTSKM